MRILCAFCLCLILVACSGSSSAPLGTDGLVVSFGSWAPPENVDEGDLVPVEVVLQNKGLADVDYNDTLLIFHAPSSFFTGGLSIVNPSTIDPYGKKISRRSQNGFSQGEIRELEVPPASSFFATMPPGTIATMKSNIGITACYRYTTPFVADVYFDANARSQNLRTQITDDTTKLFSKNQGAPIAVTNVEPGFLRVIDPATGGSAVKPSFEITIEKVGAGELIGPDSLPLTNACLLLGIPPGMLGAVRVEAWIVNQSLDCGTGIVQLYGGQGKFRCTLPDAALANPVVQAYQNFQTVFILNVTYLYKVREDKEITFHRTGVPPSVTIPPYGRITGIKYDSSGTPVIDPSTGQPFQECEYYALHPSEAPPFARGHINASYSCSCTFKQCNGKLTSGECLANLCTGTSWCCV